ncbi:DEAD/DEAH box helicase [Formosa sp. Hel1_33_131]|uniref:DEAD/DEAH box helicase n=1 Tax=Formosa sp. Hel1_33_131 TaxID=1336794 RepID=UPI0009F57FA1|nr:DEAD/DEAH box helicase [Formosa sp. Hel1_33_131]
MQILERNTEFHITIPFNNWAKRNLAQVKALSYRRWDPIKKVWIVPINKRIEVLQLAKMCRAEFIKIDTSIAEEVGEIAPLPELEIKLPITATLRPYQENGIAQAMKLKRCIIGDEQGLGKTLISLSTVIGVDAFPCLVIAPSSTKVNWQREWEKFSNKKAMILDDKNKNSWHNYYQMGVADVFITNYESLKKFFVDFMPPKGKLRKSTDIKMNDKINLFKSVIVDESHRCKDTSTQQSKLVLRICQGKEYVYLLTGTPVVNKPIDLFPQLAIMNQHANFGGRKGFLSRYCEGGSGADNLKELNYKLNKYCFFRREKKDVAKDLPEKQRQTILCDITTRKEYNKAFHEFESYLKSQGCSDKDIARKLRGEIMVKMGALKRISALGKLNEVNEFIHEVTDSGEKLIVFCVLHSIVDELKKEFPNAVTVTGRDNQDQKQASIDAFQNNPNTKLIICNIKAAGVGITLTASSRVAFVEYPWTYADCVQCEDRAHRIGQTNNVMCTYFLGNRTIDEDLYKMIQNKRHTANTITGASDKMEMSFVDGVLDIFKIK